MGGDGGSIPHRSELVKTHGKKEQVSKEDNLISKWQHCALSQEPLQVPVVACQLGRLFNKEALIHYLLDKTVANQQFSYIKSLKDVKELKLTMNCEYSNAFQKAGSKNLNSEFICPITGIEMTGRFRFVYFFSCGCVLSERALREIKDHLCIKCNKVFNDDDVIVINGDDEEIALLKEKMNNRKLRLKLKRKPESSNIQPSTKLNKTENLSIDSSEYTCSSSNNEQLENGSEMNKTISCVENINCLKDDSKDIDLQDINMKNYNLDFSNADKLIDNDINNKDTDVERKPKNDKGKIKVGHGALSSIGQKFKNSNSVNTKSNGSKMEKSNKTDGSQKDKEKITSVQDDPNASYAYKSLFSTHETAKRQAKAHWVTYNPLFY